MRRKAKDKIVSRSRMRRIRERLRERGVELVFTNGCFDLLHPGHVGYLERARQSGGALVVAINSDASVRRLKGPARPVQDERARSLVLAGLASVDYVTVFEEDTPAEIIRELSPDVLVKGGDWALGEIVGRREVEAAGGRVQSVPLEQGHSTTRIIERIRNAPRND